MEIAIPVIGLLCLGLGVYLGLRQWQRKRSAPGVRRGNPQGRSADAAPAVIEMMNVNKS